MSATVDERVSDELEALQAILMDDVTIKQPEDGPCSIESVIHPSTGADTKRRYVCVTLEVKLIPGYPDCSPEVILRNPRGLDDDVLAKMNNRIDNKLSSCLGQPVVFELIALIRECLTESNLPSGQCVICLFGFKEGDVFIKTHCYHYYHNKCLATHLILGKKFYEEELEKLPNWQQVTTPPYKQTCPVCRSIISCDVDELNKAPPSVDSANAKPFALTSELKKMQEEMAAMLARQAAKGGVIGIGDTGPPPLTITSPEDSDKTAAASTSEEDGKLPEAAAHVPAKTTAAKDSPVPASPQKPSYKGPYRGFDRRGKPGRRGRGSGGSR